MLLCVGVSVVEGFMLECQGLKCQLLKDVCCCV